MTQAGTQQISTAEPHKPARSDGIQAQKRLLLEALRLFSENGFEKTAIRAIAQAAGTNISAISYYFGDKEGLYRSTFRETYSGLNSQGRIAEFSNPDLTLQQAIEAYFSRQLFPLGQGERMLQCLRLHMREMLEPTGQWEQEIEQNIAPVHDALAALFCRHLGLEQVDEGVQRLVLAVVSMPFILMTQSIVHITCPHILQRADATSVAIASHVRYALALVESERAYRKQQRAQGVP